MPRPPEARQATALERQPVIRTEVAVIGETRSACIPLATFTSRDGSSPIRSEGNERAALDLGGEALGEDPAGLFAEQLILRAGVSPARALGVPLSVQAHATLAMTTFGYLRTQ